MTYFVDHRRVCSSGAAVLLVRAGGIGFCAGAAKVSKDVLAMVGTCATSHLCHACAGILVRREAINSVNASMFLI